jgi:hypothetical protein
MVKQVDSGQKGAELLAIVPLHAGAASKCSDKVAPDEMKIDDWSGYFKGAKGDFVFFDGDDGYNGGLPFGVYDSRTGRKIFEDSARSGRNAVRRSDEPSPFKNLRVITDGHGMVLLRYVRVIPTDCDLQTERTTCWKTVKAKFGLTPSSAPTCSGYEHILIRMESVLAYPVHVSLSAPPIVKAVNGPIKCWPID